MSFFFLRLAMRSLVLILLFTGIFCYGSANNVEVLGTGECVDCKENNIKASDALLGLKVTVDCKVENGEFQTRGVGKLNEEGDFKVSLPQEIMKDGKLAEECYVQLHNAANTPCGVHNGLHASKITILSESSQKHTFGPTEKLKVSSAICTSATLSRSFPKPSFKTPSFPKAHHLFKKKFGHLPHNFLPPFPLPPKIPFKKPCSPPPVKPTPAPEPKPTPEPKPKPAPEPKPKPAPEPKPKPTPEPTPEPTPKPTPEPTPKPTPEPKACPPHIPFFKSHPIILPPSIPIFKPHPKLPPPFPVYKPHPKILPPSIPISKPLPKILPPPFPTYKPHPKILPPPNPFYKPHPKILPPSIPIYKPHPKILSPFHKKPCPPIGFPKLPPLPTIPPKYFHHPVPPHH